MIYFTSDLHYGHANIISLCNRPFRNVNEMNQVLINNWNKVVTKNDTVYILGDIAHRVPVEKVNEFINQLNGKKILVKGNHDEDYDENLFEEICDFKEIKYHKVHFSLMHYPLLEWPGYYSGAICLHGHQHNNAKYNEEMKKEGILRYDVGVDANEFTPVSIEEIMSYFNTF